MNWELDVINMLYRYLNLFPVYRCIGLDSTFPAHMRELLHNFTNDVSDPESRRKSSKSWFDMQCPRCEWNTTGELACCCPLPHTNPSVNSQPISQVCTQTSIWILGPSFNPAVRVKMVNECHRMSSRLKYTASVHIIYIKRKAEFNSTSHPGCRSLRTKTCC